MGAGIPLRIPGVLDRFVHHEPAEYPFQVSGAQGCRAMEGDSFTLKFNPRDYIDLDLPALTRPSFLAIVASNTLAITLLKKANGRVDGFVVEGPIAGGHNAPPSARGRRRTRPG